MDKEFVYNYQRRLQHWKNFLYDIEMPDGFFNSSLNDDVYPSIEHESGKVHIFFVDVDGWCGEWGGKEEDLQKYYFRSHDELTLLDYYDYYDDDNNLTTLLTNDWNEVLEVIEKWNQRQRFIKLMDGVDLPDGFELDEKSLDLKVSAFPVIVNSTDDKDNPTIEILLYDYIGFKSLGWDDDILKETWEKIYPNEYKNNEFRIPRFQIQFSDYENLTDSWDEVLQAIEKWRNNNG